MTRLALPAGLLLLGLVWFGPLLSAWRGSLSAHMVAHMSVIAIAAPLIAIGVAARFRMPYPVPAWLSILCSVLEFVVVWSWHAPAMRAAAEASLVVTVAEQATFLIVGLLLWWTSFAAPRDRSATATGAFALLLTSIHMTLLGALLTLSPRPLFGAGDVICFGTVLAAEDDQQLGGAIMLLVGAVIYLAGGLALVARLLQQRVKNRPSGRRIPIETSSLFDGHARCACRATAGSFDRLRDRPT